MKLQRGFHESRFEAAMFRRRALIGFALIVLAATSAAAVPLHYLFIVAAFVLSAWTISKAVIIEPPQALTDMISAWSERLQRRFAVS